MPFLNEFKDAVIGEFVLLYKMNKAVHACCKKSGMKSLGMTVFIIIIIIIIAHTVRCTYSASKHVFFICSCLLSPQLLYVRPVR